MPGREGQIIDGYRLLYRVGSGTFGEVYLAENLETREHVAVKLLLLAEEDLTAFVLEARTTFRLRHPHIVQLLDFGISAQHIPYLVMTYAPGGTLRARHPQGSRLSLDQVVSYLEPLAEALQYAHERRVIHRDIKPENVLIGPQGTLLLSDFGIALMAPVARSLSTQNFSGTVPYMAPEQIQGKPYVASDQYALGIMVYEWFCGTRPFRGTLLEILDQHRFCPPPSLRDTRPDLPSQIEEILFKALAKDPRQRFARVQDFALALQQAASIPTDPSSLPSCSSSLSFSQTSANSGSNPFELTTRLLCSSRFTRGNAEGETTPNPQKGPTSSASVSPENTHLDFFISYSRVDRARAMWVAACLQEAGYAVLLPPIDFRMGCTFKSEMKKAFAHAKRMLVVLSPAYLVILQSCPASLSTLKRAIVQRHECVLGVCVHDYDALLAELSGIANYVDVTGEDESIARAVLLAYIHGQGITLPSTAPPCGLAPAPALSETQITYAEVFAYTARAANPSTASTPETHAGKTESEQAQTPAPAPGSIEVFFSYSHKDEEMKQELEIHLSNLKRQQVIIWHDREIKAGNIWEEEIEARLSSAQIILLLVSPDFIASTSCYEKEMLRAIERHRRGKAHVVPIILRPTHWERTPFVKLQMLPPEARAVTMWPNRDEAFVQVVKGVQKLVDSLSESASVAVQQERGGIARSMFGATIAEPESLPPA